MGGFGCLNIVFTKFGVRENIYILMPHTRQENNEIVLRYMQVLFQRTKVVSSIVNIMLNRETYSSLQQKIKKKVRERPLIPPGSPDPSYFDSIQINPWKS